MNINKTTCALISTGFLAAAISFSSMAAPSAPSSVIPIQAPLQVAAVPAIAKDFLVATTFNPKTLFGERQAKQIKIHLPEIGTLHINHEQTSAVDSAGKVLRWVGHIHGQPQLQVQFVRGISGHITGTLDTPKGRVLLGNANGQYFFHSEASDAAANLGASKLPAILLTADHAQPSTAGKQHSIKPDPKLIAYPVEFNAAGLSSLNPGQDTTLSLPGTGDFVVTHDGTQPGDLSGATFIGHLKDYGDDFRVLVTYTPSGAQGSILTPYGEFQLQTLGSSQWLVDITRSKLEQHESDHSDAAIPVDASGNAPTALGGATAFSTAGSGTSTGTATTGSTTSAGKTQIDVLVLYTPGLEKRFGSSDQALARIQLLTALTNQAYQDSNINISLRLVKAVKLDMADTTPNTQMLSDMLNGKGAFINLANLKQTYGADLVTLVRPFYLNEQGRNCGVGYVGGYGGSNIANYKNYGLSVVSDGTDMGGQNYLCNNYTFAHELGHNMGSMHDRQTVSTQGGGTGAYPYSFGSGQAGSFGTVMSYISPVVGKFSSPDITCSTSKLPCGVAASDSAKSADNALSLNNTRNAVSTFMPAVDNLPLTVTGVVATQGKAVANVSIAASTPGVSCSNSGSNGIYSCTVPAKWSGNLTPNLSGYQFTPSSHSFSNLSASVSQKNFEAATTQPPAVTPPKPTVNTAPVTVSGTILNSGRAVANVPIYSTSAAVACTRTDAKGAYTCRVPASWSGLLIPIMGGYQFAPSAYGFDKVNANTAGKNFQARVLKR